MSQPVVLAESPRRRVTRIGPAEVRKDFGARTPLRRLREALKSLVGATAAQREARALRGLARAGVAAPPLVSERSTGFGTRRVELGFVEGIALVHLLGDRAARRPVLERVGQALRCAHEAGWLHGDLHEENVLVHAGHPVLIDWQRARRGAGRASARARDAARFEHSMWLHGVPLGDRMRFRRAALGIEPRAASASDRVRLRAVGRAVERRARDFAATRARRALRAEEGRARIALPGLRGLRLPSITDAEVEMALDACARPGRASCAGGTGRHRVVVRVGGRRLVVTSARREGLVGRSIDALRGSPARRAFRAEHERALLRAAPPRPQAWIERRRFGLPVESWLVCDDA